jgi:SpoVK/Ycf46/Vps4 family AAA+-type ATPase
VGETEKNLRQILAAAEAAGSVLFFDEGDSLLAKRGDIARGTDRYANHEVSYLLQALEMHDGIVIAATNLKQNLDQAFHRRFDVSVEFPPPTVEERLKLWAQELGEDAARGLGPDLLQEFSSPELTGGNIANAARLATALARDRGAEAIEAADVRKAIAAEFYKLGSAVQGSQWAARAQNGGTRRA